MSAVVVARYDCDPLVALAESAGRSMSDWKLLDCYEGFSLFAEKAPDGASELLLVYDIGFRREAALMRLDGTVIERMIGPRHAPVPSGVLDPQVKTITDRCIACTDRALAGVR